MWSRYGTSEFNKVTKLPWFCNSDEYAYTICLMDDSGVLEGVFAHTSGFDDCTYLHQRQKRRSGMVGKEE